jgi:HPt (histidine-containing phosphotransfer) domain-containing protein
MEYADELSTKGLRLIDRKIPGLDIVKGLERFEGNEEVYLKTLRAFSAGTKSMLEKIETVSEDTLKEYKIKVHGIKGACYDINANELGKSAEELEKAATIGDISFIIDKNPAFLESAYTLVGNIEDLFAAIEAENPKQIKDKPNDLLLAKLAIACDNYDLDEIDKIMAEIEMYQYDADDGIVKKIQGFVSLMQFSQIVELLTDESE